MDLFDLALSALTSPYVPQGLLRSIVRGAVGVFAWRLQKEDRRLAAAASTAPAPAGPLYLVDGYHGGVVFWDWLVLPDGGLWYLYNWPLCVQPALERAAGDDRLRVVLDLDAYSYEEMARKAPQATEQMRQAVQAGWLEVVNGTYGQPLAQCTSGESFLRQLGYGLAAIREALGAEVRVYYSQEPAYFPQLPQLLLGFGFEGVVFRTQWAAFGTDPAYDATVVRWRGPDGTIVPTVPRYTFQNYERQRAEHPGLANMSLGAGERPDWEPESLAPFEEAARRRGIDRPLVADLKDANMPDAPWSRALEAAGMENVHFVTLAEYFNRVLGPGSGEAPDGGPVVEYGLDDIPSTLPWGLQAEGLLRTRAAAEGALLVAERLDAVAHSLGRTSDEERLERAWKELCLAQHHDLQVCGPWHSVRHGRSMAEVGQDWAVAARQRAEEVTGAALDYLADRVGGELVVFNPSPWPRRDYIEVTLPDGDDANAIQDAGEEVAGQVVSTGDDARTIGFVVELPSLGYRSFLAIPGQVKEGTGDRLVPGLENDWYSATVQGDGSLRLEAGGRCLIRSGNYFTVWRDGVWHDSRQGVQKVEWVEGGPAFKRCLVGGELAGVPFRQLTTFYRALARIDVGVTFEFGEEGVYLGPQMADDASGSERGRAMSIQDDKKLCVALDSPLGVSCCDSAFLLTRTEQARIAGLRWVGLEGEGGGGIALLNRGTRGYHFDREAGVLRNVLAWGPEEWIYASDNSVGRGRSRYTALRGQPTFEYAILPYDSRLEAHRAALDYQLPLQSRTGEGVSRDPTAQESFLGVEPEEVVVSALFVAVGKVYARLWNCSERERTATLWVDGERELVAVELSLEGERRFLSGGRVRLRPWGVQTIEIGRARRPRPGRGEAQAQDGPEEPGA